jgi:hypothetical protein
MVKFATRLSQELISALKMKAASEGTTLVNAALDAWLNGGHANGTSPVDRSRRGGLLRLKNHNTIGNMVMTGRITGADGLVKIGLTRFHP